MGKIEELVACVKSGNSSAGRKLLEKLKSGKKKTLSKDLNTPDENGCTIIHYCAANNLTEFIGELAELGASLDIADNKGYTPLHMACGAGKAEPARYLLGHGVDPNVACRSGDTPLHVASQNGHTAAVEALMAHQANCTVLNTCGQTPLDVACQQGYTQIVTLLLRTGQFSPAFLQRSDVPHAALVTAAKNGRNEVILLLLQAGFDMNRLLPGGHGNCLHEAALNGQLETVKYLILCGADVTKQNAQGLTPLDVVSMYADPRLTGPMKQVLQDAMAKKQQQQQQQAQQIPRQYTPTHGLPPQAQGKPSGFAYFPPGGGPQDHQPPGGVAQVQQGYQVPAAAQVIKPIQPQPGYQPQPQPGYQPQQLQQQQPVSQIMQQPHHVQGGMALPGANDIASIIAARAANRKPMTTSPTKKEFSEDAFRSNTISTSNSDQIQQARLSAIESARRRQNSLSGRSSGSPEPSLDLPYDRSNPPTLPRRTNMGPPAFKPAPPPVEGAKPIEPAELSSTVEANVHPVSEGPLLEMEKPKLLRKPQTPKPSPPQPSADNELLQKLMRRQNKITENPAQSDVAEPQGKDEAVELHTSTEQLQEPQQQLSEGAPPKPASKPPKPARTTSIQPQEPSVQQSEKPVQQPEKPVQQPAEPPAPRPKPKPKVAAPPPKPEAPTWQEELNSRKQRMAQHSLDTAENQMAVLNESSLPSDVQPAAEQQQLVAEPVAQVSLSPVKQPRLQSPVHQPSTESVPPLPVQQTPPPPVQQAPPPPVQQAPPPPVQQAPPPPVQQAPPPPVQQAPPPPVQQAPPPPVQQAPPPPVQQTPPPPVQQAPPPPVQQAPPPPVQPEVLPPVAMSQPQLACESSDAACNGLVQEEPTRPTQMEEPRKISVGDMVEAGESVLQTDLTAVTQGTMGFNPIGDWLTTYKLQEYTTLFEENGYDRLYFLAGITMEELVDIGVSKIGHRKKILASIVGTPLNETVVTDRPPTVSAWLDLIGLSQYEAQMIDAGYDDIDFITEVTEGELEEIGITKKGHLKWIMKCISNLAQLLKDRKNRTVPTPVPSAKTSVGSLPSEPQPHLVSEPSDADAAATLRVPSNATNPAATSPVRKDSLSVPPARKDSVSVSTTSAPPPPEQEPQVAAAQPPATAASRIKKEPSVEPTPEVAAVPPPAAAEVKEGVVRDLRNELVRAEESNTGSPSPVNSPQLPRKPVGKGPPPIPRRAPTTALTSQSSERSGSEAPSSETGPQSSAMVPQGPLKPQQENVQPTVTQPPPPFTQPPPPPVTKPPPSVTKPPPPLPATQLPPTVNKLPSVTQPPPPVTQRPPPTTQSPPTQPPPPVTQPPPPVTQPPPPVTQRPPPTTQSPPTQPVTQPVKPQPSPRKAPPPQVKPKSGLNRSNDSANSLDGREYSLDDITAGLNEALQEYSSAVGDNSEDHMTRSVTQMSNVTFEGSSVGSVENELDTLSKALNSFSDNTTTETMDEAAEGDEADQLLADIDDMLADLTEHLDLMIPGSSAQSKSHH